MEEDRNRSDRNEIAEDKDRALVNSLVNVHTFYADSNDTKRKEIMI